MKKLLAIVISVAMLVAMMPAGGVFAASVTVSENCANCAHEASITKNGTTTHYDTLEEAIKAVEQGNSASEATEIKLLRSVSVDGTIADGNKIIGKSVKIDLGGHNISFAADYYFIVYNGKLELTGEGTVKENTPTIAPVVVVSDAKNTRAKGFSTVIIDTGVTLEGYNGLAVNYLAGGNYDKDFGAHAYGVDVTVKGKLVSNYTTNTNPALNGCGITVNGDIKDTTAGNGGALPSITLDGTTIVSNGCGIYAAGYAEWTLTNNPNITAKDPISVKSGKFVIENGTYTANGPLWGGYEQHVARKNNAETAYNTAASGSEPTGAALSITTSEGYAGNVDIEINGGTFSSVNNSAVYEGIGSKTAVNENSKEVLKNVAGASASGLSGLSIVGGTFTGVADKNAIDITKAGNEAKISGGTFSDLSALQYTKNTANIDVNGDVTIGESETATIPARTTLTIPAGKSLTVKGKLIVNGTLNIAESGVLDLTQASGTFDNTTAADSRTLKISEGANLIVNGTLKSKSSFNDICQYGTMTIKDSATITVGNDVVYVGENGLATLDNGASIVQTPNTENNFANGYKYTLTGAATANNFEITGNDIFIVPNGAVFNITNLTLSGAKENQLTIEAGGKLVKGNNTLTVSEGKCWKVSSGTFDFAPTAECVADGCKVYKYSDEKYVVSANAPANTGSYNTWVKDGNVYVQGIYVAPVTPVTPTTDNVVNDKDTTTNTVKPSTTTAADGTKTTTATVSTADGSKIVDKAVSNKSTNVVVNAGTAATVVETAAGNTAEVLLPEQTVKAIAEKTDAAVTIKADAAEVTLDKEAVKAVAEQAGDAGTVKLVVKTVNNDENLVKVDLELVTSEGIVSDFRGGNVLVKVKLNAKLAAKDLVCLYIDDGGIYHKEKIEGNKNADGTFTFRTGHFSEYAIMAADDADKVIDDQLDTLIKEVSLKVKTTKTSKKNIKVTVSGDVAALKDAGYTVKYRFCRSTKASSNYVGKKTKDTASWTNTKGTKGTKYYYRAKVYVYDENGDKVGQTKLSQCKYSTRTWSKK